MSKAKARIGLALGSGASRGWAHIGVIRALARVGIVPEVVAGSSAGAIIGAVYATGKLDAYEAWGRGLDRRQVLGYFDFALRGGLIRARKVLDLLETGLGEQSVESLPMPFAAVATDLRDGTEVWLRNGPLIESVRASSAMPGVVTPVLLEGRWLADGGIVNPVPVSLCRALGADLVIAVDLNTALLPRGLGEPEPATESNPPSIWGVIGSTFDIMQMRITRSRMAGDPPELLIAPRLGDFGIFDFHRAGEAIEEGERATEHALASSPPTLRRLTEPGAK